MTIEVVDIPVSVALAIANIVIKDLPLNVKQSIARSSDYPVFKLCASGYVFLTYGEWLAVETRSKKSDFMDWCGTYSVLTHAVKSSVGVHLYKDPDDETA